MTKSSNGRFTASDISDSIRTLKPRAKDEDGVEIIQYNANGEADFSNDTVWPKDQVVAYRVKDNGRGRCKAMLDKLHGGFYNPIAQRNSPREYFLGQSLKGEGQPRFQMESVKESAFNLYVRFLQNRNGALLKNANDANL